MRARFTEALRIFGQHIKLFAAMILTVWLPGNIVANYIAYNVEGVSDFGIFKLTMLIDAIFSPIYSGAIIFALFQIKSGRTVTYSQAMAVGLKKWGTLLVARSMAGIYIVFGLLALIIPGIILAVRYSLLDAPIIIENMWPSESRGRSTDLSNGKRWQIFWSVIFFFITFFILVFAIYAPLDFIESLNTMIVEIVLDCMLDIASGILPVVLFLFYWEAIHEEKTAAPAIDTKELSPIVNT